MYSFVLGNPNDPDYNPKRRLKELIVLGLIDWRKDEDGEIYYHITKKNEEKLKALEAEQERLSSNSGI